MQKKYIGLVLAMLLIFAGCSGKSEKTIIKFKEDNQVTKQATRNKEKIDETMYQIKIEVNHHVFMATLYDNETVRALIEQFPMTFEMSDLHANEKYVYLSKQLPTYEQPIEQLHTGDLMLFGNDCLVVFYKDFTSMYSYTPLGRVKDSSGLVEALGDGNVHIVFSLL